jgi:uncharacterized membrane protein
MRLMRSRKGYFFVIDSIVALTIVLLGIFLLFSTGSSSFNLEQPLSTLEDFASITMARPLSESTNNYYVTELLPAGLVPFPDATPMEEIAYLVQRSIESGDPLFAEYAENYSRALIDEALERRYGAELIINGTSVFARDNPQTLFNMGRQGVLYIRMDDSTVRGPVVAEVRLWY